MDPGVAFGPDQVWRPQLWAYDPLGPARGDLPFVVSCTVVIRRDPLPTMDLYYPVAVPDVEGRFEPGARLLQDGCEIALVYPLYGNPTDVKPNFTEDYWCRFVQTGKTRDRMDALGIWHYEYRGIGHLLEKAWIQEPDDVPPEDGPTRPVRSFPAPGSAASPNFGRSQGTLWDEVVAATGWGGSIPGEKLSRNFGSVVDSAGVTWTVDDELAVELGLDEFLSTNQGKYTDANKVDVAWFKRRYEAYKYGTFGRDLTVGNAPILIRDGDGVERAPQTVDSDPVATDVRIIGDKGKRWEYHNPDAEQPRGTPEMVIETHEDVTTDDQAEAYRDAIFLRAKVHDQQTVEMRFDTALVRPLEHYRVGDRIKMQRGRNQDQEQRVPEVNVVVQEIAITIDSEGVHGHVIGGDRIRSVGERIAGPLGRMTKGARVGPGGQKRDPGDDPRSPDLSGVTAPTLTFTTVVDHNNRPRGQITVTKTWDSTVAALEPDGTASADEIRLKQYVFEYKRPAKKWRVGIFAVADDSTNDMTIDQLFDPAETVQLRWSADSHKDVRSDPVTLTSATWTADRDAAIGPDTLIDGGFGNTAINTARVNDAGAGFTIAAVSGDQVGKFTTTTPVLDMGVAGTTKSGRAQVKPGDVEVTRLQAVRAAGASAATLLVQHRYFDKDDAIISTLTAISTAVTGSFATYSGTTTAPASAVTRSTRIKASAITGAGGELRVKQIATDRRVIEERIHDDAVIARTIIAADPLTTKHTITGMLAQSHSGGTTGAKFTTSGIFYYVGGVAVFSATGSGVFVTGTLTTGSGMIVGGAGLFDLQFPSGSSYAIGESGGFLEYKAGGSGHKFTGAVLASGAITGSSSLTIAGTTTLNGSTLVNASGSTLGFYGATKATIRTITGSRGGNAALADLLTKLAFIGLIIDSTT